MTHFLRVIKTNKKCDRDHMCLAKLKTFIIWPFRRKMLSALVLVAGDTMNKTDQKNPTFVDPKFCLYIYFTQNKNASLSSP